MPTMWEYVLRADGELDLANPAHGEKWFNSRKNWNVIRRPDLTPEQRAALDSAKNWPWGEEARQQWETGVRTLRHFAARFMKARGRKPGIAASDAERVLFGITQQMRLTVDDRGIGRVYGAGHGTSAEVAELFKKPATEVFQFTIKLGIAQFFQELFESMVTVEPRDEPVCGRCGKPLERTKAGKPSRAEFCGACKFRKWADDQPEGEMKKRWKRAQKKHRIKVNGAKPPTKKAK